MAALGGKTDGFAQKCAPDFRVWFPALRAGNHSLVEAGGQHIHGFRRGLDYAFIRTLT
jgi:hypothetical protein